jgi:hypothetical protein
MPNDIPRTETSSRELHAIEYVAGIDARLVESEKYLEKRLRSVPDLYRQYRIARVATEKVLNGLYSTMTPRALNHLTRMNQQSEIVFRPKSILNKSTDSQVVLTKDLKVLIREALSSKCSMCMGAPGEIKECELRKALLNVAPLKDIREGSLCGYVYEWGKDVE